MTVSYTTEAKLPLLDSGSGNAGAVFNGVLYEIDAMGGFVTLEEGEALSDYDLVYMAMDGKAYKAKADDLNKMPIIGIATTATDGTDRKIQVYGWIENVGWSWNIGHKLYLSADTAGGIVEAPPNYKQLIGYAKTATKMLILPDRTAGVDGSENPVVDDNGDIVTYDHEMVVY